MTRSFTTLQPISSAAPPPEFDASLVSNFIFVLAALICALISILSLIAFARCVWLRRVPVARDSPATVIANKGLKKKVLNLLPKFTYLEHSPEKWIASSECAICLSEFTAGEEVKVLPQCGHSFHVACVDMWLESHSSCPSCRALAGVVAGEMETKSVGGENGEIGGANSNPNCYGITVLIGIATTMSMLASCLKNMLFQFV